MRHAFHFGSFVSVRLGSYSRVFDGKRLSPCSDVVLSAFGPRNHCFTITNLRSEILLERIVLDHAGALGYAMVRDVDSPQFTVPLISARLFGTEFSTVIGLDLP